MNNVVKLFAKIKQFYILGNSLPALQGLKSENLTPTPNATGNAHQEAINQSFWSVQRQTLKDSIIWPPLQPQPGVNASTSTSQNCRPIDWNVSSGMNSFVATELNEPRYITQQQYWPTVAPFPSQPPAPPQIQMERGHNLESLNICNPIVPHHDASPTYDYNHASRGPQASHQGPNQGTHTPILYTRTILHSLKLSHTLSHYLILSTLVKVSD